MLGPTIYVSSQRRTLRTWWTLGTGRAVGADQRYEHRVRCITIGRLSRKRSGDRAQLVGPPAHAVHLALHIAGPVRTPRPSDPAASYTAICPGGKGKLRPLSFVLVGICCPSACCTAR